MNKELFKFLFFGSCALIIALPLKFLRVSQDTAFITWILTTGFLMLYTKGDDDE